MAEPAPKKTRRRYDGFESIGIPITIRVGRTRCAVAFLAELGEGEVIPLDRPVGTAFDLLAGGRVLARVEPVAVGDRIGVKLAAGSEDDDDSGE
jgi:flagellar motor switch protein FliN/FliY